MIKRTVGFVGGGRITRIMLAGWQKQGQLPGQVVVSDVNVEVLQKLQAQFPDITVVAGDNRAPSRQELVFIALHPPAIGDFIGQMKEHVRPEAVLVSLAPKLTIAKLSAGLGGSPKIARMIPNAPSIIGQGYNPVAFSPAVTPAEKAELLDLFNLLGECPEVAEDKLEAYAILTAMGPTYLWFQLYELQQMAQSFGLGPVEVTEGISHMVTGAIKTMFDAGLTPVEVMDLVPVKPLGDEEANIKGIYHAKLEPLYQRLKG